MMRPTELIAETGPLWHTIIHQPAPLSFKARKSVEERIVRGSLLLDACNLRCAPWVSLADSMRAYLQYQLLTIDNKNRLTQLYYRNQNDRNSPHSVKVLLSRWLVVSRLRSGMSDHLSS